MLLGHELSCFPLFLLFYPCCRYPRSTSHPPPPPILHLSNLNAYRRLSSPRLAVLSAEITCALTDLWEAARRGRLNLAAMFFPRRVHIHRNVAIATNRPFTNIPEYFLLLFLSFFFSFSNVNCSSIILSKGRDSGSALSFDEVRYRGIRNSIERYPPRGKINKAKDAYSGERKERWRRDKRVWKKEGEDKETAKRRKAWKEAGRTFIPSRLR